MANDIRIKGTADFSSIAKEVKKISSIIDDSFGDKGVSILDPESVNFVKAQSERLFTQMDKRIDTLKKKMAALDTEAKKSTTTEREGIKNARERLKILDEMTSLEQQRSKMTQSRDRMDVTPTQKKELAKLSPSGVSGGLARVTTAGVGRIANQLPGVSEAMGVANAARVGAGAAAAGAGGLSGAAGMIGGGLLGAGLGVGALGAYRAHQGFEEYKQNVPTIMNLEAMGMQGKPSRKLSDKYGYNAQEQLQQQEGLARALGTQTGKKGANRQENTMLAARDLAIAPEQIIQSGNQLRQTGGTESASKQLASILDKAVSSGMDKSQASHYLAAATGLLTSIDEGGVSNTDKLLSVLTDLTASGNMSAEQASKSIKSVQDAIANSEGEANAFFQAAAANAGHGGGTLLGTQLAVRQGLEGIDLEKLTKQIGDTQSGQESIKYLKDAGLGKAGYTQEMAKALLEQTARASGGDAGQRLGLVGKIFGAKTGSDQAKVVAILERMAKGSETPDDKKMLKEMGADPAETWRTEVKTQLETIAGNTAKTEAEATVVKFDLGKEAAPIFNDLTRVLMKLDESITKILAGNGKSVLSDMGDWLGKIGSAIKDGFLAGVDAMVAGVNYMVAGLGASWDYLKLVLAEGWAGIKSILPEMMGGDNGKSLEEAKKSLKDFSFVGRTEERKVAYDKEVKEAGDAYKARQEAQIEELKKINRNLEKVKNTMPPNAGRSGVTPR